MSEDVQERRGRRDDGGSRGRARVERMKWMDGVLTWSY
jgi:hypothetical protein